MKRILIGVTYYYPNISGVSQYAKILAEELAKENNVEVISAKFRNNLINKENINGVNVLRIDGWQINKGIIMWSYPLVSLKAVKMADIINCHLPSLESFWLALWGRIFGKKIVVTHHCEFAFDGTLGNRLIAFLTLPSHFLTYLMANKIVAYTEDYANNSIFLKIFFKKIIYILPPIKLERGQRSFDFGKEKIIAFVGRIAWEKGLDVLIEAMKKVKGKLILVGPYEQVIGDQTANKLKEKVKLFGPLEHEYLEKFYKSIDCLVLPSINNLETFGIVQAEAMKCGTPVVASNLPGVRVPVQMTGMGEISKIGDSNDLANKINLVLKNGKNYYQKRATNLDKLDYQKTVKEYEKIFGIS